MEWNLTPKQDAFLGGAMEEYNSTLQSFEKEFEITDCAWEYSQDDGVLALSPSRGGSPHRFKAEVAGSFSRSEGTWEWAWNNPYIEDGLKVLSLDVKKYGDSEGLEYFSSGIVDLQGQEEFAAYLAAVSQKISGAEFVYRGDAGDLVVYLLVTSRES